MIPASEIVDTSGLGVPPLRFVEDKRLDWDMMARITDASVAEGQWANFGPVSRLLEATLQQHLAIPEGRCVISTSSGSAALLALAGVAASHLGRPVRWVGSAFGFLSTRIGPYAGTTKLVDCDENGFLDLSEVDELAPEAWDGLIVTNVFGADPALSDYVTYCGDRGKLLIADNAMCLYGFDRTSSDAPAEIVSFHHTKPWGFGEGGCAILPAEDAPLFRHLINCGYGAGAELGAFAGNGRISDLNAAAILQRLNGAARWVAEYVDQWHRVAGIATGLGFEILLPLLPGGVTGFVPLLASGPVTGATLAASVLPLERYYPPLAERSRARGLFERIVCVPCHSGMKALRDEDLKMELQAIAAQAESGTPQLRMPGS